MKPKLETYILIIELEKSANEYDIGTIPDIFWVGDSFVLQYGKRYFLFLSRRFTPNVNFKSYEKPFNPLIDQGV